MFPGGSKGNIGKKIVSFLLFDFLNFSDQIYWYLDEIMILNMIWHEKQKRVSAKKIGGGKNILNCYFSKTIYTSVQQNKYLRMDN